MDTTETKIHLGSKVKVLVGDGPECCYVIGNTREANPTNGVISDECPMGRALLGAKPGDSVSYQVGNRQFTVRVLEVL